MGVVRRDFNIETLPPLPVVASLVDPSSQQPAKGGIQSATFKAKVCKKCGAVWESGWKRCEACRKKYRSTPEYRAKEIRWEGRVCKTCGTEWEKGWIYCKECRKRQRATPEYRAHVARQEQERDRKRLESVANGTWEGKTCKKCGAVYEKDWRHCKACAKKRHSSPEYKKRSAVRKKNRFIQQCSAVPGFRENAAAYQKEYRLKNMEYIKERDKKRYAARPNQYRAWDYKRKYGISLQDYEKMVADQGGRCAICRTDKYGATHYKAWPVDHDHSTGKVRGLLCHNCNHMLGMAKDNPQTLAAGIEYLRKSEQKPEINVIPFVDVPDANPSPSITNAVSGQLS